MIGGRDSKVFWPLVSPPILFIEWPGFKTQSKILTLWSFTTLLQFLISRLTVISVLDPMAKRPNISSPEMPTMEASAHLIFPAVFWERCTRLAQREFFRAWNVSGSCSKSITNSTATRKFGINGRIKENSRQNPGESRKIGKAFRCRMPGRQRGFLTPALGLTSQWEF